MPDNLSAERLIVGAVFSEGHDELAAWVEANTER